MSSPYNLLPYPLTDPYGAGQVNSDVSYYGTSLDHAVEESLLKFVRAAKVQNADKPDSAIFQVYDQIEGAIVAEQVRRKLAQASQIVALGTLAPGAHSHQIMGGNYINTGNPPLASFPTLQAEFDNIVPDMRLADSEYSTGFPWLAVGLAVVATAALFLTWVTP